MELIETKDAEIIVFKENDITLELYRIEKNNIWNCTGTNYQCNFIFKNCIGVPIKHIVLSEDNVLTLLLSLLDYVSFPLRDVNILLKDANNLASLSYYILIAYRDIRDTIESYINTLCISNYNEINKNYVNILSINICDDDLYDFIDIIYDIFLVDLGEDYSIY